MKLLSRAEILSATDKRTMTVATPEWGADTSVLIGVMGPLEYARLVDYSDSLGTPVTAEPADDEEPNVPDDFCCDSPAADIPGDIDTIDADQSPPILPTAADERDKEEAEPTRTYTRADLVTLQLRWAAGVILDPDTKQPAFSEADIEVLGKINYHPIERICTAAHALHLATPEANEDAAKNSDGTPSGASGSA